MTKLISIISFFSILLTTVSCRQNDEVFSEDNQFTNNYSSSYLKREIPTDTTYVKTSKKDSLKNVGIGFEGDPPPKTGQQWRTANAKK
ncbi:hypothetical protein [Chryseobacterium sp. RLHN22]|uniref:hypothetical protein n=1 Tax=Chryseobacterium sp. RLHN22 TaxID=3437885 RepID=UPI003D9B85F4